jgi:pimeloyl-ACP methyl ester carboxylesterase
VRPLAFEDDIAQRLDEARPSMLFEGLTPEELEGWQRRFRTKLRRLIAGQFGVRPARALLRLEWEREVDCGAYVRRRLRYQTEEGVWVPAYLLVPTSLASGERAPALLCLHGHGRFGKDSVAGIGDTPERAEEIRRFRYDLIPELAGRGYVVLAPDLRGFGERRPGYPDPEIDYCARNYLAAALLGTTVVAFHLCDLGAALDVLQSLSFVDGAMLGCVGLSFGGRLTMLLAALDARVTVAVASGCLNLFQERYQILRQIQCGAQLIPGLLCYGDTPEIFSLIAPRPLVLEVGLRDDLIPRPWAERGLARIRQAYAAAGAPDRLVVDEFDSDHHFHGGVAWQTLWRWRAGAL